MSTPEEIFARLQAALLRLNPQVLYANNTSGPVQIQHLMFMSEQQGVYSFKDSNTRNYLHLRTGATPLDDTVETPCTHAPFHRGIFSPP